MNSSNIDVTKGNPLKVFFAFCIPGVAGLMAISSAETIDAIFIGNYAGSVALAAVNLVIPSFYYTFGLAVMIVIGSSVRSGKYIGEGDFESASAVFSKSLIVLTIISLLVTSLSSLAPEMIVRLLGANDEVVDISARYLQVIMLFTFFFLTTFGLAVFVRTDGRPILASVGLIIGSICNFFLDWLLIARFGMGVTGAAIATGSSQIISFVILLSHFFSPRCRLKFTLFQGGWSEIWKSCYNGISELINEISGGVMILVFNWIMIARMGVNGVAAFTVINFTLAFGIMVSYGIADAALPIISINLGAKRPKRVMSFLIISLVTVLMVGLVLFSLLTFFPEAVIDVFLESDGREPEAIALSFTDIVKYAFLLNGVNIILSSYFTAMHRPMESALVAVSRGLLLPLAFLLFLPMVWGTTGIYLAVPAGELITFVGACLLLLKNRPKHLIVFSKKLSRLNTSD